MAAGWKRAGLMVFRVEPAGSRVCAKRMEAHTAAAARHKDGGQSYDDDDDREKAVCCLLVMLVGEHDEKILEDFYVATEILRKKADFSIFTEIFHVVERCGAAAAAGRIITVFRRYPRQPDSYHRVRQAASQKEVDEGSLNGVD